MFNPCFFNESRVALYNQFRQRSAGVSDQRHPARRHPSPRQQWGPHSLDAVVELLGQGDHNESETTKECKDECEGEVVDPIFDPIEEEPDEDGRKGVRFEVVIPVPHPSRDLRVVGA